MLRNIWQPNKSIAVIVVVLFNMPYMILYNECCGLTFKLSPSSGDDLVDFCIFVFVFYLCVLLLSDVLPACSFYFFDLFMCSIAKSGFFFVFCFFFIQLLHTYSHTHTLAHVCGMLSVGICFFFFAFCISFHFILYFLLVCTVCDVCSL